VRFFLFLCRPRKRLLRRKQRKKQLLLKPKQRLPKQPLPLLQRLLRVLVELLMEVLMQLPPRKLKRRLLPHRRLLLHQPRLQNEKKANKKECHSQCTEGLGLGLELPNSKWAP
jgi:hypothetical protein